MFGPQLLVQQRTNDVQPIQSDSVDGDATPAVVAANPPLPTPTPVCGQPTLTLGSTQYPIESLARADDGSVVVPPDKPNVAHWVDGTVYVFGLSPTPTNLALETTLKSGDAVTIAWGDCSSEAYVVKAIEPGQPNDTTLFDQPVSEITVFVQASPSAAGLVIRAGQPEASAAETPSLTEANAIQAEVSFLDTTTSPDGVTVKLSISIKNTGSTAFTLTDSDIALTAENAAPLAPLNVEPALPREIQPGASETLSITFPKPAASTAVFKILDFSVDLYF
jgi:hypothetical protein